MAKRERVRASAPSRAAASLLRPGEDTPSVSDLNALFDRGNVPDAIPEGFLPGRVLTTSLGPALDRAGRALIRLYMPWIGKRFEGGGGINLFLSHAWLPLRLVWPTYRVQAAEHGRLEAFRFTTSIGTSALESGRPVLRIDYDLASNPRFIVRQVLDEVVQVGDGVLLGRSMYRYGNTHHRVGFFCLGKSGHAPTNPVDEEGS